MKLEALKKKDLPEAIGLRRLLGPSFILLGLGLGSGELILWPYLTSKYGLGIIWGAIVGITFQFFLNMEIERYTLITGESVFVGLARKMSYFAPVWFIFSTLIPWMWPGIIASSAVLFSHVLGINYSPVVSIGLLVVIGAILTLGPLVYRTQEIFQRSLILVGVPFIFLITALLAEPMDWGKLSQGVFGKGEDYWVLPAGISIATFLGAFAYSGAGGNLNLAQSYYVKEKGYGMGKFSGRITSILTGKKEKIELTGTTFESSAKNLENYRTWWRRINIEHSLVFWATGAFTMVMLSLLSYITIYGSGKEVLGVNFIINEASVVGQNIFPVVGTAFLLIAGLMLFSTQFSVLDATSRIMSENLVILSSERFHIEKLNLFYYIFLWVQILAGILIFAAGFSEPLGLVIIGAVLNAFTMFVYCALVVWLNKTNLDRYLRPSFFRTVILIVACLFYGGFSVLTIWEGLFG